MRFASLFLAAIILTFGTSLRAQTNDPSSDQFVDIQQEPQELTPFDHLIVYPEAAQRSGLEGTVTLQALIDQDGIVKKVDVLSSDYDVFKQPAIDAMMKEKFSPAISEGKPLKVWITRKINFKLQEDKNNPSATNPFLKFMGISLDSARKVFQQVGEITETKTDNGIHLHAVSSTGYSNGNVPYFFDAWVGPNGVHELVLDYKYKSDKDFNLYIPKGMTHTDDGGKIVAFVTTVEYPAADVSSTIDEQNRTLQVRVWSH